MLFSLSDVPSILFYAVRCSVNPVFLCQYVLSTLLHCVNMFCPHCFAVSHAPSTLCYSVRSSIYNTLIVRWWIGHKTLRFARHKAGFSWFRLFLLLSLSELSWLSSRLLRYDRTIRVCASSLLKGVRHDSQLLWELFYETPH